MLGTQIGPMEVVLVLVIALVVLGPKRLPEAGRSMGRGLREFRDSLSSAGHHDDELEPAPEHDAPREQAPKP
jgi:sec-independent protein translocase protein TatA